MTYTSPFSTAPRRLLKLFIFLFILVFTYTILFSSSVSADPFYPSWNIYSCKFAHTTAIQYSTPGKGVIYNPSDLNGETNSYIETHRFTDVANPYYPNAKRFAGIADKVSVPPNTKVDIGSYVWNYTGHNVYVDKISLFMSRPNPSDGDLTRLGAVASEGTTCWNSGGNNTCRTGKKIDANISTTYAYHENALGRILYSFETIQPIKISNVRVIPEYLENDGGMRYRYEVTLQNVSSYDICGLRLSHKVASGNTIELGGCVFANSSFKHIYHSNYFASSYPRTISHNTVTLSDPNRHNEIVSIPNSASFESPEETNAVVYRDDQDQSSPSQAYGTQPGWGSENGTVSVELIPYSISKEIGVMTLDQQVSVGKYITDSDETERFNTSSNIGEEIKYTLYVQSSASKVNKLTVIDDYDENSIEILDAPEGVVKDGKITYELTNLYYYYWKPLEIKARIKKLGVGKYDIKNNVSYFTTDPLDKVINGNTIEVSSHIEASPILNISKSFRNISAEENERMDKTYIVPGDKLEFKIKYSNTGNTFSEDTKIYDTFNGIEVDKVESENGVIDGKNISWEIPSLEVGSEGELTYYLYTKKNVLGQTSLINTAIIEAKEMEKVSTSLDIPIKYPLVRLEKKIKGNSLVTIGDEVIYQIKIINDSDFEITSLLLTDELYEGFISEEGTVIKRNIDKLLAHEERVISLKVRVSEMAEYSNLDKINNKASLTLDNHEEIFSEADINVRCGNVSGIAWEDSNKDGIIDENENRLENVNGHIYLMRNNQKVLLRVIVTNETGKYEAVCIPQNREVVVEFEKLDKFTNYSTPITYTFILSNPDLETVSITSVDSKVYNQAFTEANLGAYVKETQVLAETGDNINDMLLLPIGLLGIPLLVILKKFKRKKFVLEASSCRPQPQ